MTLKVLEWLLDLVQDGDSMPEAMTRAYERAVTDERERCSDVVLRWVCSDVPCKNHSQCRLLESISLKIRSGH